MQVSLYIAIAGMMLIVLSMRAARYRQKTQKAIGMDEGIELQRRVRAQGNFVEYTPMALLMIAVAEVQGLPGWGVHVLGAMLLLGRALHAYSLLVRESYNKKGELQHFPRYRFFGMVLTVEAIGLAALVLLVQASGLL